MKYEIENKSECKRTVKISLPADEVSVEYNKQADLVRKNVALPGFRKGKAPMKMILDRFNKEIKDEVIRDLLPEQFKKAVSEAGVEPVSEPIVEGEVDFVKDGPLVFSVSFEVMPEVKPVDYKGIKLEKKSAEVKDEEIDRFIDSLRNNVAEMEPVEDRPSKEDDHIYFGMEGKKPDSEDIFKEDNASLVIGDKTIPDEFSKEMKGLKPGDEKTFSVQFPEDHGDSEVAGKKIEYKIRVTGIKEKILPALDDNFAKMVSEDINTLEELKNKARKDIENNKTSEVEADLRDSLMKKLCEMHSFEVPDSFVEREKDDQLRSIVNNLAYQGLDPSKTDVDWKQIREKGHGRAIDKVKGQLLIQTIADIEGISVETQEMNDELEKIAKVLNEPKAKLKANYMKSGLWNDIKSGLRTKKTIDFLLENAKITERKEGGK